MLSPPASKVPSAPLSPKYESQASLTLNLISPSIKATIYSYYLKKSTLYLNVKRCSRTLNLN